MQLPGNPLAPSGNPLAPIGNFCYMKKNVAFKLISFAVLKSDECLSFQVPFELPVEIPVQLHLELEVN